MSHSWLLRKERSGILARVVWFCFLALIIPLELALLFSIIILLLPTSCILFVTGMLTSLSITLINIFKYLNLKQAKASTHNSPWTL